MLRSILLTFLLIGVFGCSHTIDFSLPADQPLSLSITVKGAPAQQCTLAPDSEIVGKASEWIKSHSNEWEPSPATYVPSILLSGDDFSINFLNNIAILNYSDGQFTHKTAPHEYSFLACP